MPADSTFAFEACAPLVVVNSFAKSIDDGLDLNVRLACTTAALRRALEACGVLRSIRVYRHEQRTLERLPLPMLPTVRDVYIAPHRDVRLCDVSPALEVGVNVFVDSMRFNAMYAFIPSVCTARVHASRVCIELDVSEGPSRVMVDVLVELFQRGVLSTRNFELRIQNVFESEVWTPEALVPLFRTKELDTIVVNDHRVPWFERGGTMKTLEIQVQDGSSIRPCIKKLSLIQLFPRLETLAFKNCSGEELCFDYSDVILLHEKTKKLEFHNFSFRCGQVSNQTMFFLLANVVEDIYFHDPIVDETTGEQFDEWLMWMIENHRRNLIYHYRGVVHLQGMLHLKCVRLYTAHAETINIQALRRFFEKTSIEFWLE
jgi:hypothetical protein